MIDTDNTLTYELIARPSFCCVKICDLETEVFELVTRKNFLAIIALCKQHKYLLEGLRGTNST